MNTDLIKALKEDAEWAHANEWETPITLGDHLDAAADALEKAEVENRWFPVGERLPKTEKPVQVYMPKLYMSVQTGFYTKYYGEDDGEWYEHWVASGDVTHWRPLPQPPQKG